ncbi:MAG: HDOD domain-containing protein [Campylobacteraceae bacterium]|nr:HDOD domain-containing protein [Campylobacteraceae bacterium]
MISIKDLDDYIASVPPLPKVGRDCSKALEDGDLILAAEEAVKDGALMLYLKQLVNKPIYGFRTEIKDPRQLFGILGLERARQLLYAYYTQLLVPKKWEVFELDTRIFQEFQANLMLKWERILNSLKIKDPVILKSISLIPAALAACEAIFKDHLEIVKLIHSQQSLSYEAILTRMTGMSFHDITSKIARKWDLPEEVIGLMEELDEKEFKSELTEYLKLLIQYELSRPALIKSGANDFFEFVFYADEEILDRFYEIISKVEDETNG